MSGRRDCKVQAEYEQQRYQAELRELATLKDSGALPDAEFQTAKACLLV